MPQGHHHHENKQDKSETRNLQAVRRAREQGVALKDKPMPLIDIGIDKIDQLIKSIINPNAKDSTQEAWLRVLKEHPINEQSILDIALEVKYSEVNQPTEIGSIDKPLINNNINDYKNMVDITPIEKPTNQLIINKLLTDKLVTNRINTKYNEFEDDYFDYVPKQHKYYELNGDNYCPRCHIGIIILDRHDKICLCCGLRDSEGLSITEYAEERLINWLITNKPRQLFSPPKNC